ncbi:homoserine kinase [Acetobacter tropicalis]|uniref:homoserine kinase n=1 Tax=Acetobacter TaxID=434 RepID=UPI001EDB4388|nr:MULTISPECIES: homoserine kinase [Acetobacter]MCC6104713.1 homoserine kinase [Acetobacter sp.]MCG4252385.1 homoserine kinase [Acetobacter senegalensis]MCG4259708.1 homoserine kinase [Acetobacter senegalensis]MDN7355823.1 homoserine kinase [Acetobacter senegalensis]
MAVYTDVSDEALEAFLADYAIGGLVAFRGIAEGVENSNFQLRTTQGDFILTLYEKRVNVRELPWFLGLMQHLAVQGVTCPQPVADKTGTTLKTLAGRPAAITTFLPGVWPRKVRTCHCRPLGRALAQLHEAGRSYAPVRHNSLGPAAWQPLLNSCRSGAETVQRGLEAELDAAFAHILPLWPGRDGNPDLPRGQIHADLFPDNVFFLHDSVSGLIDFYFACTDILAYDIAICLNAWCFDVDGSFNVTFARQLLQGYQDIRPLSAPELAALPVLARGAAMRFLLTRLYDWINTPADALVTPKDPLDYLKRLRFHLATENVDGYGV